MTPRFLTLFWHQAVRQAWRHPLLAGLNVLSIALGITVFLAVQIANLGALTSFRSAADLTTGRAQLEVRGTIDDSLLPAVSAVPGILAATPLVEGVVTLPDHPGEYLRILGIDPFTGSEIFAFRLGRSGSFDLEKWLADPEAVALQPERSSSSFKIPLRVLAGTTIRFLHPAFSLEPKNALASADTRLAAMDIGWAQELLGLTGRLSSIQILLENPADADRVARDLRRILPPGIAVAPPALRSTEMENMLGAFQLNLTAMSLVSIIVGMFLIHNSVSAAVVRRRAEIAILRAVGTTRLEIRALCLAEAALEAVLGSALGILFAPFLAQGISAPVSESVSSLYTLIRIESFPLAPWHVALAFGIGIASALIAAWLPASEAAKCEPARILHPGAAPEGQSTLPASRLVWAALLLAAAFGASYLALHGAPRYLGFASAAAVLAGFSLLIPWLAAAIALCFRHVGPLTCCAADQFSRSLQRNAITIAALAAALAMMVSVTVMIYSFRASVTRWIEHTLSADLYIAPAVNDIAGLQAFLPPDARNWAAAQDAVAETATFREFPVRFQNETTTLSVIDGRARGDLEFLDGSPPGAADDFRAGKSVALSESFARRFDLGADEKIPLPTPQGEQLFSVRGIYRDFTRDRGTILMPRKLFDQYWRDDRIHSLALKLRDVEQASRLLLPPHNGNRDGRPTQAAAVTAAFRSRFGQEGQFAIYDNATLRRRIMDIFDQTFAVTSVLRNIAIIVAVAGVLFSLSVLVMERDREIGVLRAVGASRAQIAGICMIQAILIGLTATISGLASGGALAMVLTWVINKAFFGWTIELAFPLLPLAAAPFWLIPVAILAALIPAWRASRIPPAQAVRFE
jgi:putative ABC transport system permease protein